MTRIAPSAPLRPAEAPLIESEVLKRAALSRRPTTPLHWTGPDFPVQLAEQQGSVSRLRLLMLTRLTAGKTWKTGSSSS